MKNSLLLTLATGLVLSLTIGCKTPQRHTTFPETSGSGPRQTQNLNTTPLNNDVAPIIATGELADDAKLIGRDEDRARFAAQTVYFEFDRHNVQIGEAPKVQQVASEFKTMSAHHDLLIEGHCDERGTEEYNRALGERRALALRELLVQSGVDSSRVHTKSFGEDRPADAGHDEAAWNKNRRGEFILVLPRKIITTQSQ